MTLSVPLGVGAAKGKRADGLARLRQGQRREGTGSAGGVIAGGEAVAMRMPANTPTRPAARFQVIGSPTSTAASTPAAIGLTVMVVATRVGVARCSAITQRMNASAPPPAPR